MRAGVGHAGARALAVAIVLAASAVYAGCSSDDATTAGPSDAGDASPGDASQAAQPQGDGGAPPSDSGAGADANASDAKPDSCSADGGLPDDLACTGLYADFAAKSAAPNVRAYAPGAPVWSDGADKSRWVYLPAGTKIDTSRMDEWTFPNGTKIWKEFRLGGKRIETRLFS